jgi:hypothetical protein
MRGSGQALQRGHEPTRTKISRIMPLAGTAGRIRRLEKRASPELKRAIEAGLVSPRKADQLLYLPKAKQRAYIAAQQRAKDRERARLSNTLTG